jgi:hypothetical protein
VYHGNLVGKKIHVDVPTFCNLLKWKSKKHPRRQVLQKWKNSSLGSQSRSREEGSRGGREEGEGTCLIASDLQELHHG